MTTSQELLGGDLADVRDACTRPARRDRALRPRLLHRLRAQPQVPRGDVGGDGGAGPARARRPGGVRRERRRPRRGHRGDGSTVGRGRAHGHVPAHCVRARETILRHGNEEQKARFVAPTATGESRMAFAITEPNAGTNSWRIETTALLPGRRQLPPQRPEGLHLGGRLVGAHDGGVPQHEAVGGRRPACGHGHRRHRHEQPQHRVAAARHRGRDRRPAVRGFFTDVVVPAENVIGEPDKAFRYMSTR